jgi:hypothetical protein
MPLLSGLGNCAKNHRFTVSRKIPKTKGVNFAKK